MNDTTRTDDDSRMSPSRRKVLLSGATLSSLPFMSSQALGQSSETLSDALERTAQSRDGIDTATLVETDNIDKLLYRVQFNDASQTVIKGSRTDTGQFTFRYQNTEYQTKVTQLKREQLADQLADLREIIDDIPVGGEN